MKCHLLYSPIYNQLILLKFTPEGLSQRREKKCDRYREDLKKATGASVEEEYYAGSLKHLQENMTLSKSKWGKNRSLLYVPNLVIK